MKIKKFDELILESVRKLYLKIKEDSENNLAYLLDDGYQVNCKDDLRYITVTMNVLVGDAKPYVNLHWSNIKDDFISYLEYMNDKYNIEYIELKKYIPDYTKDKVVFVGRDKFFTIEELENMDDFRCVFIKIAFNKRWKK
jgi:hypothetical protein